MSRKFCRNSVFILAAIFTGGCDPLNSDRDIPNSDSGNTAPAITSNGGGNAAQINASEDQSFATTVTYTDTDIPADTITYDLAGNDATEFAITSSGVLTFVNPPDFENPTDDDADGTYEVTVMVDDGNGGTDSQDISVTVFMAGPAVITTSNSLRVSRAILGAILVGEPIPPYCDVFSTDPACSGGAAPAASAAEPGPLLAQASAFEDTQTTECDADRNPDTPHDPDDGYVENFTSTTDDFTIFDPPPETKAGDIYRFTAYQCNNGGGLISNGTTESEILSYTTGPSLGEFSQTDKTTSTDNSITWLSLSWDPDRSLTLTLNGVQISTFSSMDSVSESLSTLNGTREISDGRTIVFTDIVVSTKNDFSSLPVWPVTQNTEFGFDGDISHTDFGFAGVVGIQSIDPWVLTVTDTRPVQDDPDDPLESDDLKITYDGTIRMFIEGAGYVDGIANGDAIQLDIYEDGTTLTESQNYTQEELFYGDLRSN